MRYPYAALFYTLLLSIAAIPVLRTLGLPEWPVSVLLAISLVAAAVGAAEGSRRRLVVGGIVAVVLARLAGQWLGWGALFEEASSAGLVVIAVFGAAGAVRFMFRRGVRRGEQLYAALSAYLLVGLFMGVLYTAIAGRSPEAFLVLGAPASPENFGLGAATYFSFVTLATLGYGDIVPATDMTRGLAIVEAIGGQLYLAVLVASLIGVRDGSPPGPPRRPPA